MGEEGEGEEGSEAAGLSECECKHRGKDEQYMAIRYDAPRALRH